MPATASINPARRLLGSPLVDLLVGPHGIDRYLELIRPQLTIGEARAEVLEVQHQTDRSVTLTLRPNRAWEGFRAGQFVRVGVEIDGVRRTRTFSPASSEHRAGDRLELTATLRDGGLVSDHLRHATRPGAILHLSQAEGDFVLPDPRPDRLALISGGSGITPLISMLRTLCDEGHNRPVAFLHYARTREDWLYRPVVQALADRHPNLHVAYLATRQGDRHLTPDAMPEPLQDPAWLETAQVAVCGPPPLIEAAGTTFNPERVLSETFTPPSLSVTGAAAEGTIRFVKSGQTAPIVEGTLLELAEAAGLSPDYGCRLGICKTCTCRKAAGTVRNLVTGEVSAEEDEDIQLCVSVPAGDVALEI
jgi:ferredoxin-NADP reductase